MCPGADELREREPFHIYHSICTALKDTLGSHAMRHVDRNHVIKVYVQVNELHMDLMYDFLSEKWLTTDEK